MNNEEFSEEQQEIFDAYLEGKNIFMTGPGGCGKSYIIKKIYNHAKEHNNKIQVCAMTGCASVLLNCRAKTLHSWSGIGLGKGTEDQIINRITLNKHKKLPWRQTQILILDEVSMLSKKLFDLLDSIGKNIRKNTKPFGGIQIIFSGDFFQLAPIGDEGDPDSSAFCFESELWDETFDYQILMDKIYRQKDEIFVDILNQVREGCIYKQAHKVLLDCLNKKYEENETTKPVILLPTRSAVEKINYKELDNLKTESIKFSYEALYEPNEEFTILKSMKKPCKKQMEFEEKSMLMNCVFDKQIELKVGCQVMCIANLDLDNGICNGSTGIITNFKNKIPIVKFDNGKEIPIGKKSWESENIPGFIIKQIPLILAWAVTIHKSQGATLEKAEIDIGNSIFAPGQTYVALSRVKSLDGLYLKSYNPMKIKTNKKVLEFYERFFEEEEIEGEVVKK